MMRDALTPCKQMNSSVTAHQTIFELVLGGEINDRDTYYSN